MEENPIEPPAPEPAAAVAGAPSESAGPTLDCRACGKQVLSGLVRCPSCGGSTRTVTAMALAALAALAGLAALVYYGAQVATAEGNTLRPAFFALAGAASLLGAWSAFQGRRAGWLGLQLLWAAQVLLPLLYAALLHRGVVQTLVRDPQDFLIVKLPLLIGVPVAWLPSTRHFCAAPSNMMTMMRRELGAFFFFPLAYVIMTAFLLFVGVVFYTFVVNEPNFLIEAGLNQVFGLIRWILMVILAPVLTMRLLAEEKKTGTIELLMTAPVTDIQIVLAKFLAVFTFFGILVSPTLVYVVMMTYFSMATPDYGLIVGGYFSVLFMATASLSAGLFVSSLTRNQILAAVISFVVLLSLWILPYMVGRADVEWMRNLGEYVNFMRYHEIFTKGVIDSRAVVFDLSLTALFLFLTVRVLESRRWA